MIEFENTSKEGDKVTKICEEIDVSTFGFFQRNSIGEFIRFTHTVVLGKKYSGVEYCTRYTFTS